MTITDLQKALSQEASGVEALDLDTPLPWSGRRQARSFPSAPGRSLDAARIAYYQAIGQFLDWCQRAGFSNLEDIEPIHVAAYIEQHSGSAATIKQHMAAIRMMFSWLTEKGILAINPAREVKTPKFSRTEGKTPAFSTEEVQKVLASIDTSHVVGHRDKAFLATLAYTFARIRAVVNLKVEDYFQAGKRSLIRFKEKGGKEKEIPVHHKLEEILDEYLKVSKLREKPDTPLFPTTLGKSRGLGSRPMTRFDGANLLKRRLRDAGIVGDYSPHSFRATGITNYLENGGTLEVAQRIAGHADSRTTKLYDRRGQKVLLEDRSESGTDQEPALLAKKHVGLCENPL